MRHLEKRLVEIERKTSADQRPIYTAVEFKIIEPNGECLESIIFDAATGEHRSVSHGNQGH